MNVYEIITEQVIKALEDGTVPWRKPWQGDAMAPKNLVSGKAYRGINTFLLSCTPYVSPYWLSFKQAKTLGGSVRKGEKGSLVVFWKMLQDKADPDKQIPLLRYYRVWNLEQCDGVTLPKGRELPDPEELTEPEQIAAAEAIAAGYPNGPTVAHGDARAYYVPATDSINMPARNLFDDSGEYYSTLFHELGHSTGHKDRLNRENGTSFGSHAYGREELVAEMTSTFLCSLAGIDNTIDNSSAYLASWIKTIREDTKAVVVAAGKAQRAADHILGKVTAESEGKTVAA